MTRGTTDRTNQDTPSQGVRLLQLANEMDATAQSRRFKARPDVPVTTFKGERRVNEKGHEFRLMTTADGYVMARRPGCMPFVMTLREWTDLKPAPHRTKA